MMKVEINRWITESLMTNWDVADRVLGFGSINLCATIKEYSRILEIHYNRKFIVAPHLIKVSNRERPKSSKSKRVV